MMTFSDPPPSRVVLFQVADASSKLKRIVETVRSHFIKKERFILFVEDEKGEKFVDELLWKFPDTAFLPHGLFDETSTADEWITITKSKIHKSGAVFAFNLCPTPLLLPGFKIIYDFEDLSTPHKQNLSSLRFNAYKEARLILESR